MRPILRTASSCWVWVGLSGESERFYLFSVAVGHCWCRASEVVSAMRRFHHKSRWMPAGRSSSMACTSRLCRPCYRFVKAICEIVDEVIYVSSDYLRRRGKGVGWPASRGFIELGETSDGRL